ncbi:chitin deacetylase [Cordyceps fumosorosea ARSEF 2679]|uniref:Chitin deacetylase n=1 Tax=Cordyceps fumosorosea (strain ARSEF 2679) TaxID=1081104 RepID=A0A167LZ91_CORFA|nr:chitin deacetylase [Cordyceps fumosorosea ARSEF 2679]OAA53717.1 chitin deacetylase [Cordyceps fumosorosea ARSEF 2679]
MKPSLAIFCLCLSAVAVAQASLPGLAVSTLHKRQECGAGVGSCAPGQCCSEGGWCGTSHAYCGGSQCQLEYCDSCDTFKGPSGPSTEKIPRDAVGNVPYGTTMTSCKTPGMLALTFDDGPDVFTPQILDILSSYNVKATFFIAGNNRDKGPMDDPSLPWPRVLRRMHAEGHQLASHTWTHRNLNKVSRAVQFTEMIFNEMAFRNVFGWAPTYMRPPYLECSAQSGCTDLQKTLGYHVINSNIDTKDYLNDAPENIHRSRERFEQALVRGDPARDSFIVLAHDVHYHTVVNLTTFMIETARARGYKLVTVGECLGDPQGNWYRNAGKDPRAPTPTTSSQPGTTRTSSSRMTAPTMTDRVSPDQTCGGSSGNTCQGSRFGNCCSFWGFCGSSNKYCGTGCDVDFGTCNNVSPGISDTTNGLCGAKFAATCLNYGSKRCCSESGYCGDSSAHCGAGCQDDYGRCD